MDGLPRRLGPWTAALVVVASMIGVGVFTTTGFLVRDVGSPGAILAAWALGGVVSLCGALCYAELGSAYPHNGGEYLLLGKVYHPAVGFAAGFVSLVAGFAAPAAAAAHGFGRYLAAVVPGTPPVAAAAALLLVAGVLHAARVRLGGWANNAVTLVQVALIVVFVAAGIATGEPSRLSGGPVLQAAVTPGFAVGLIFVAFSYSGWNAAAYLAGELERPERVLPRALLGGTALVTALYLGLNAVFLAGAPADALSGVVEVGHVAASAMLGEPAAKGLSAIIAIGLAASVSAMVMTGPRVVEAMGLDHRRLRWLAGRRSGRGPIPAIALQTALSLAMVLTASFEALVTWIGFVLVLFAGLTAVGVVVSRWRRPGLERPYRLPLYPVPPAVFGLFAAWVVGHALWGRPVAGVAGLATAGIGLALYAWLADTGE